MKLKGKGWMFMVISIFGCIMLFYFGKRDVIVSVSPKQETFTVLPKHEAPLITLFTTWSAYPEAAVVYNNTLRNWLSLQPQVNIILFTNDNIPAKMKQLGWTVLPVPRQIKGHPVLKEMLIEAKKMQQNSKLYGFVNGDILLTDSLINSLQAITNSPLLVNQTYMVVGRRMNTPNIKREEASSWETIRKAAKRGKLMPVTYGIDYFLTTPDYHWKHIPDVQVGNYNYDNWLVWDARRMGHKVIDATGTLLAVHQNAPYPKKPRRWGW